MPTLAASATPLSLTLPAAILPSLLLLWHFHRKDRFPEPYKVVIVTFALGVACVVPVLFIAVPVMLGLRELANPIVFAVGQAFLAAAVAEETCKFAVVRGYSMRHDAFDESMDGLVYGVAASLGFATFENVLYVLDGGLVVAALRALTAVPGHAMMGAVMGYYLGEAHFQPQRRRELMWKAWAVPVMLHGMYDLPLMLATAGEGVSAWVGILALPVLIVGFVWALHLSRQVRAMQDSANRASIQ